MAHKYDSVFKLTLQRVDVAMRELVGSTVTSWKTNSRKFEPRGQICSEKRRSPANWCTSNCNPGIPRTWRSGCWSTVLPCYGSIAAIPRRSVSTLEKRRRG